METSEPSFEKYVLEILNCVFPNYTWQYDRLQQAIAGDFFRFSTSHKSEPVYIIFNHTLDSIFISDQEHGSCYISKVTFFEHTQFCLKLSCYVYLAFNLIDVRQNGASANG